MLSLSKSGPVQRVFRSAGSVLYFRVDGYFGLGSNLLTRIDAMYTCLIQNPVMSIFVVRSDCYD
jgi:hypothetical protein